MARTIALSSGERREQAAAVAEERDPTGAAITTATTRALAGRLASGAAG